MDQPEDPIAQAERQVRDREAFLARQSTFVMELERNGYHHAATLARRLLVPLWQGLTVARDHLRAARAARKGGQQ